MVGFRVVFFGTPAFAVPTLLALIGSRHTVVGVVTQPDRRRGRGQKVTHAPVKAEALGHNIPIVQPERLSDPSVTETCVRWAPDIGVVAAYGQLIPPSLLATPPLGMINVHASLLPLYRGAAPVHRAIIDGATHTGVTIMRVVAELDAGGTFASLTRPIGPDETSEVVERDLAVLGAPLLLTVLDQICDGTAIEQPQNAALSTYAPRLTKAEGLIDWSLPARRIHDRVRGLYPWPHAYTYLAGQRVILLRTVVEAPTGSGRPGTIVALSSHLHVSTGQGGQIGITELQLEGGRAMSAREFLAGRHIAPGAQFTTP